MAAEVKSDATVPPAVKDVAPEERLGRDTLDRVYGQTGRAEHRLFGHRADRCAYQEHQLRPFVDPLLDLTDVVDALDTHIDELDAQIGHVLPSLFDHQRGQRIAP